MSPSVLYWISAFVGLCVAAFSAASAAATIAIGLKLVPRTDRCLNWTFVLFAGAVVLMSAGSAVGHVAFWVAASSRAGQSLQGPTLFWIELATVGYLLLGPSLLAFAHEYANYPAFGHIEKPASSNTLRKLRRAAVILGFVAAVALLPAVFSHRVVQYLTIDDSGMLLANITTLGYVILLGPVMFGLLALVRIWTNARKPGGKGLTLATILWLVATIAAISGIFPWVLALLALGILVTLAEYIIFSQQILKPVATLTDQFDVQLAERTRDLEHVRDMLQWRIEQQRHIAEINSRVGENDEPDALLALLAELLHTRLGYQHVYVYLVENDGDALVMRAAAGATGRTMLKSAHPLTIGGHSLAGLVAEERRSRRADDEDAQTLFASTTLPGARSEMSVPLLIDGRLLGVLDFQSIYLDAFTDEDLNLVTSLADQITVTLDRCQSYKQVRDALDDEQAAPRAEIRQGWSAVLAELDLREAFVCSPNGEVTETNLGAVWSPDISRVASSGRAVTSHAGDCESDEPDAAALVLTLPVLHRGQMIGSLQLRRNPGHAWDSGDIEMAQWAVEHLGLALEKARLLQTAQRRADREQFINRFNARLREETDVESLLDAAVGELGAGLGLAALDVRLRVKDNGNSEPDQ